VTLPHDTVWLYQQRLVPGSPNFTPCFQPLCKQCKIFLCEDGFAAGRGQARCIRFGLRGCNTPFFKRSLHAAAVFSVAPVAVICDEKGYFCILLDGLDTIGSVDHCAQQADDCNDTATTCNPPKPIRLGEIITCSRSQSV